MFTLIIESKKYILLYLYLSAFLFLFIGTFVLLNNNDEFVKVLFGISILSIVISILVSCFWPNDIKEKISIRIKKRERSLVYCARICLVYCVAIICSVTSGIIINGIKKDEFNNASSNSIKYAKEICEEYLHNDNPNIYISKYKKYEEYKVYTLIIDVTTKEDIPNSEIYKFVDKFKFISIDYDNVMTLHEIKINGKSYNLGALNENVLECNGNKVYTYISNDEKLVREELKDILPYEGMSEEYIGFTSLGEPDKSEYWHVNNRHLYYYWYDEEGEIKAEAFVSRWDSKSNREIDGYILSFNYYGE